MYGVEKPLVCPIEAAVEIGPVGCDFHFKFSPILTWAYTAAIRVDGQSFKHEHNINKYTVHVKKVDPASSRHL